jgi:Cys-tRNA(Pro)/Cys-tRNA(Cys) deacylase
MADSTRLPAHKFLDEHQIPYQTHTFMTDIPKTAFAVAEALGYEPGQIVKTLIFQCGTGEKVLVMVGADQNVVSGLLKKAIGNRNIKMATPPIVESTTGYEVGSIPPFSWQPKDFRTFLDKSLLYWEILGVGAGLRGHEIMLTPRNLIRASQAIVVNLCDRDQPVFEDGSR